MDNKTALKLSLGYTIAYFIIAAVVVYLGVFRLNVGEDRAFLLPSAHKSAVPKIETVYFWQNLVFWDARWYRQIVEQGYTLQNSGFFPIYPLTLYVVEHTVTPNFAFASALISFASITAIIFFLLKLYYHDTGQTLDSWGILFTLFFPTAIFWIAPYSEGMFTALTLAALYFLQTGRFAHSAVVSALVGATRLNGCLFSFVPLYLAYKAKRAGERVWPFLVSAIMPWLGLAGYMVYQKITLGTYRAWLIAEASWRRNTSLNPVVILQRYRDDWLDFTQTPLFQAKFATFIFDVGFSLLAIGLIIAMYRQWKKEYALYAAVMIVLPLVSGTFSSMPRFILPAVPLFAAFLSLRLKDPAKKTLLLVVAAITWGLFLTMFVNEYWIA